jgi:aspartyl-tRNA synthetase
MYRTHTCGELRIEHAGNEVTLAGWVQRIRNFGGMIFIDLRDRYGITQLVFNPEHHKEAASQANELGREYVIAATGKVTERSSKNVHLPTGEIEIFVSALNILNASKVPPLTIEDETDGGEDIRMKYRYLRPATKAVAGKPYGAAPCRESCREYLDGQGFVDVETPHLIKRHRKERVTLSFHPGLNPGQFYALPQYTQTFKQLLMVSGYDRYYQIVRCFRDEDLRQDRQPEFTQIDCEMAFVEREDVLQLFEGMVKHVFRNVRGIDFCHFPRMNYEDA